MKFDHSGTFQIFENRHVMGTYTHTRTNLNRRDFADDPTINAHQPSINLNSYDNDNDDDNDNDNDNNVGTTKQGQ